VLTAAAQTWQVDVAGCITEPGEVVHPASGKRLGYGELVSVAKNLPVPKSAPLKKTSKYRIIGTDHDRLDSPSKVDGSALYGADVRVEGMRFAAVVRPMVPGGSVKSFESKASLSVPGVEQVVQVPSGVAVVAKSTWAALKGRKALTVTFNPGPHGNMDDGTLQAVLDAGAKKTPKTAKNVGKPTAALAAAAQRLDEVYQVPFLAHVPMEPFVCLADVKADHCTIWAPTQNPMSARKAASNVLGLPQAAVDVHTTYAGGRFGCGHRTDFVVEAVRVSKAVGAPVQVLWSREDDTRLSWHRPFSRHVMSGGLDKAKQLSALSHVVIAPSIGSPNKSSGMDWSAVSGVANMPYNVANLYVGYVMANTPVPITWWRSVYLSQNPFAQECFLDELAHAGGHDPLQFRTSMMGGATRLKTVLQLAADKAGWGKPMAKSQGRGLACVSGYGSHIGMVAEVAVDDDDKLSVLRIVAAVDCGRIIHPDGVSAQIEGGVAYALSAALYGEMNFAEGEVVQGNFHQFDIVGFKDMPTVEVHLVESTAPVGGVGELGVPPVAPAVANALFAATGKRLRKLPLV